MIAYLYPLNYLQSFCVLRTITGYAVDEGVHYLVAPAPLQAAPPNVDFGYLEFYKDKSGMKLVWEGNGPNPDYLTMPPYGGIQHSSSTVPGWPSHIDF